MSKFTHGALFSGSGGFELAAAHFGIETLWASEIEPFAIAVTKKNFPEMKHLGDISRLHGYDLPPVDIISGGSPCQDMSVAGRREGLVGSRSVLFMEFVRIVKEMREAYGKPRFMLWENVPGAFSSNKGEDFRCVLEEIARIADEGADVPRPPKSKWGGSGAILVGDGSIAWRTLDAQFWGVPQRRRRIYLVADFGKTSAPEILFEREGLSWDFAKSQAERQASAGDPSEGTDQAERSICLNDQGGDCMTISEGVTGTLRAQEHGHQPIVLEYHPQDSRISIDENQDAIQTLTGKMGTGGNNVPLIMEPVAVDTSHANDVVRMSEVVPALQERDYKGGKLILEPHVFGICSMGSNGMKGDNPDVGFYEADTVRTLDAHGGNPACNQGGMVVCEPMTYAMQGFGHYIESDVSSSLKTRDYKDATDLVVDVDWMVRRITPLECCRLQGFPDDWTDGLGNDNPSASDVRFWMEVWAEQWSLIGREKGIKLPKNEKAVRRWLADPGSDSDRYKLWGNGIALPCALFVFEGIAAELAKEEGNGSGNIQGDLQGQESD